MMIRVKMSESEAGNEGSIVAGIIWMFVISILLFWLPLIGPLVAGFVGGKKAGGIGAGLMAVFLPAIVFGVALFFLASSMTGIPIIGAIASVSGILLSLINVGPLLVGAIIGGAMA